MDVFDSAAYDAESKPIVEENTTLSSLRVKITSTTSTATARPR